MKILLTFIFLFFKIYNVQAVDPPYGQLSVEGKELLGNGKQVALHGMSLFQSNFEEGIPFYDPQVIKALKCQWNSNVVRLPMGIEDGTGPYLQNKQGQRELIEKMINAAIAEGIYVIVDWHSHNAQNQEVDETEFFQYIAGKYGKFKNIIYELFNEPLTSEWAGLKVYQQKIVNAIRAIDPENLIIAGTPTYSQGVDLASQDKLQGKNICYSLHFYAASHKQDVRNKAGNAQDNVINGSTPIHQHPIRRNPIRRNPIHRNLLFINTLFTNTPIHRIKNINTKIFKNYKIMFTQI